MKSQRLIRDIQMAHMQQYILQMHMMNEEMIDEHRRYFQTHYSHLISQILKRSTG